MNTAKLDVSQVIAIRKLALQGVLGKRIAEIYGVTPANVSYILKRKSWAHVA